MVAYCSNNLTLHEIWYRHGFTPCFIDTLTTAVLLFYTVIFGLSQLIIYKKSCQTYDPTLQRPINCLYRIQLNLHIARLIFIIIFMLFSINGSSFVETFTLSSVLKQFSELIAWSVICCLLLLERNCYLPSNNNARIKIGHGPVILVFYVLHLLLLSLKIVSYNGELWFWKLRNTDDILELVAFIANYTCLISLLILGFLAPGLPKQETNEAQYQYGTLENQNETGLKNFWRKLIHLLPYLWPRGNFALQVSVILCILILIIGRVVNVYIPLFHKWIVDSLSQGQYGKLVYRWDLIVAYTLLLLAQGGAMSGGMLSSIRTFLWIKVQQYTTREIEVHLYTHLHSLSLRWHLSRKTGEVLRVMDRGTNSINQLLAYLLFNIVPTVIDIIVAIVYFTSSFNLWFGVIVFVTMVLYLCTFLPYQSSVKRKSSSFFNNTYMQMCLAATILITEWRTKYRRLMNRLENAYEALAVDALLNFETVKYYNAEMYEVSRYREALLKYQDAEWDSTASMSVLNFVQNFIITGGLLVGSLLCAWFVVDHDNHPNFTVGSYVLFASYIMQLYQPLNWLGSYYRIIQQSFVDMENMFDLLKENQDIQDLAMAPDLRVTDGKIEFQNVSFRYNPDRPILKNVNFTVEPGKSVALVGPSGSGKSTVIRLLFRFYDVESGCIRIDGQDISAVKQSSLRQRIGVVPQDTVLFNETIKYNIRYGKTYANDEEVYDAARAAEIHDKILTFSDGYSTIVGERGLKLSGGEKQRVAIARTILKAPNVVLLDEATSALDTRTERLIQSSLDKVCVGRTTIIVAHRLSTIINVDEILVLKDGIIIERGNHEALLTKGEIYSEMWKEQLEKSVTVATSANNEDVEA